MCTTKAPRTNARILQGYVRVEDGRRVRTAMRKIREQNPHPYFWRPRPGSESPGKRTHLADSSASLSYIFPFHPPFCREARRLARRWEQTVRKTGNEHNEAFTIEDGSIARTKRSRNRRQR